MNFFPEIESGLIPVLRNIGEIVLNDRIYQIFDCRSLTISDEPLGVSNQCRGAESLIASALCVMESCPHGHKYLDHHVEAFPKPP